MTIAIAHSQIITAPNVEGFAWQHDRPACGYDPVSNTFLVAGNSLNDTVYRMDMNGIVMEVYDDFTHGIRAEEGAKIGTAGKMNFADFQWVRPDVWIVVMEYYYVGNASAYYTVFVEVDLNLGTAVRLPHIATGLVSTEINGWITPNPDGGYYVGQAYVQQVRNIGPNIFYVRDLRDQSPASWKRLVKYTADGHDNPTAKYGTIGFGAEFKVLAGQKWYHSSTVFGITTHGPYLFCWGVFSWGNPFYDNRGYLADHFKPVCLVYLRSELNGVNLQPQPIQMIDIDGILEPFAKEGMRSNYRFGVTQNGDIVHLWVADQVKSKFFSTPAMHTFTVDVGVADATVPPVIDVPPVIEPVPTEPPVIDETPTTPVRETFKIDPKESWDVYDEKGTHVSFHNNMSNAIQKITNAGLAGVHGYTAVGRVTVDVTRKVTTERQ